MIYVMIAGGKELTVSCESFPIGNNTEPCEKKRVGLPNGKPTLFLGIDQSIKNLKCHKSLDLVLPAIQHLV